LLQGVTASAILFASGAETVSVFPTDWFPKEDITIRKDLAKLYEITDNSRRRNERLSPLQWQSA
jgi:SPX domain protein involved in polyphosphate accumulation